MTRTLYTWLLRLIIPLALARLWWRSRRAPGYRERIAERFGRRLGAARAELWIHAVSVGEVQAAALLISELRKHRPGWRILVTTTTPTGAARLSTLFGDELARGELLHRYTPYDLPGVLGRFLHRVRPNGVVIMETEIWPNLLACCAARGIPVLLANARLSAASARGYARLGRFATRTLLGFARIAAQTSADARRFITLGVPPELVVVTGSIKFDLRTDEHLLARSRALRAQWGERPVWIAASTHEGEEAPVLAAQRQVLSQHPGTLLVLVPRHPERFERVARLVRHSGLRMQRHSAGEACQTETQVLLGDTMGELATLLAAADGAFMGGSLKPVGGHNPLEAAVAGVPVLTGPHTDNFAAIFALLEENGGALRVTDASTLATRLTQWFDSPETCRAAGANAQQLLEDNRGALERLVRLVDGVIPKHP